MYSVFKELHARVERESGWKLKAVRVDNRGEYWGQFEEYCRSKRIWLCKDCRAEANVKTEIRDREGMRRFNGSLESRTVRGRERE